ncbi:hypothetical protein OKW46_000799 [Paraburkholderia sp. WSM4179]|nr:hypothetical protein [Paraburkholderia sp. WSM4179]
MAAPRLARPGDEGGRHVGVGACFQLAAAARVAEDLVVLLDLVRVRARVEDQRFRHLIAVAETGGNLGGKPARFRVRPREHPAAHGRVLAGRFLRKQFERRRNLHVSGCRRCRRRQRIRNSIAKASRRTHETILPKVASQREGLWQIRDLPPTVLHVHGKNTLLGMAHASLQEASHPRESESCGRFRQTC